MEYSIKNDINTLAYYKHNNGDLDPVTILDYDGKGRCWVRWQKDDFVNMVDENRLEIITIIRSLADD